MKATCISKLGWEELYNSDAYGAGGFVASWIVVQVAVGTESLSITRLFILKWC